ncbi:hypothetical protein B0T14DRAFT_565060 [Immersiella caudata]|uniref:Uncharacterized protein n=1 Tax=Immersiella caudata TaxID=314043 RepID=A0AA40C3K3_9PEZI|nr:hypothetical protein B0T14DRAFT_565060 [Immersiella caudata]
MVPMLSSQQWQLVCLLGAFRSWTILWGKDLTVRRGHRKKGALRGGNQGGSMEAVVQFWTGSTFFGLTKLSEDCGSSELIWPAT